MKTDRQTSFSELLFYCVIVALPFEEITGLGGVSLTKLIGVLFLLVSLANRKAFFGSVPLVFLAYFLYAGIGMVLDIFDIPLDFALLNAFVKPLLIGILMIVTYNLSLRNKSMAVMRAVYLSSLIYAVAQAFGFGEDYLIMDRSGVEGIADYRTAAFGMNPNFAAFFIGLSVLAGIAYGFNFMPTRLRYRILALTGSAIGFYAILGTSSRGGVVALFTGVSCVVLTAGQWRKRVKYALAALICLCVMSVLIADNPMFKARILSSLETGETAGRGYIWETSVRLSMDSPIYGFGHNMYVVELGKRMGRELGTHNLFLSVLLGSGFLGLSLFLYFYLSSFKNIWSHKSEGENIILFGWFMMAMSAALSSNIEIAKWFWIILALALGAGRHQEGMIVREAYHETL